MSRSGSALATWELSKGYGFVDVDGTRPDWGAHFDAWSAEQGAAGE